MRFVADESLDAPIVAALRAEGHEITYVAEVAAGSNDPLVLALAHEQTAVLLTADKDFGELIFARGLAHSGVVLVRLHGVAPDKKAEIVAGVIRARGQELPAHFTTIDDRGVRIRGTT